MNVFKERRDMESSNSRLVYLLSPLKLHKMNHVNQSKLGVATRVELVKLCHGEANTTGASLDMVISPVYEERREEMAL